VGASLIDQVRIVLCDGHGRHSRQRNVSGRILRDGVLYSQQPIRCAMLAILYRIRLEKVSTMLSGICKNHLMVGRDLGVPVGCVVEADKDSDAITAVG
jgi:hypothetical protein